MVEIETRSGLCGELIAYAFGWAIVRHKHPTFPDRPFSVNYIYTDLVGDLYARSGTYDLTTTEAYEKFAELTNLRIAEVTL